MPRARADLRRIYAYLADRSPRGAARVVNRILNRVRLQLEMPLAAPLERDGPERCLVITRTPYLVLYAVDDDTLTVVAIYHAMQDRR